jgi:hypothetical protein
MFKAGQYLCCLLLACTSSTFAAPRLNDIQVLGSHNSYRQAMDAALMAQLRDQSTAQADALDYHHLSLTHQLRLGIRQFELDVFHDPNGGLYAEPSGLDSTPGHRPFDSPGMQQPGLKVLHIQDIDFRSSCPTLKSCLLEMLNWSRSNPRHLPIIITMNAKDAPLERTSFVNPLPFDELAFNAWDQEIIDTLGRKKLITPDDVRGKYATLREAVLANRWPSIRKARGKFLFVVDEPENKYAPYIKGHPSLAGRIMFVNAAADRDEAAFLIINDPIGNFELIQQHVRQGFLVRTRADADTIEARINDPSRSQAAFSSGAQFISTDYYISNPAFDTGYQVKLPGSQPFRCNPIRTRSGCNLSE